MHEQSLVRALLNRVEQIRRQRNAERVREVHVEIGPLSGVEPLLLASAFEQLSPDSAAAGAILAIDEVALVARCIVCDNQFEVNDFVFRCPLCRGNVKVIQGDEFLLASVSLSSREPTREMVS